MPPMVAAPAGAKVVASDFYRGKVKSIYEREPLFRDFAEVSMSPHSMRSSSLLQGSIRSGSPKWIHLLARRKSVNWIHLPLRLFKLCGFPFCISPVLSSKTNNTLTLLLLPLLYLKPADARTSEDLSSNGGKLKT